MRISDMFYAGSAFLRVVFFKQTIPLAVSYLITNRCNYSCSYCGRWRKKEPELATDQIIFMIDELAKLGTRFLQVTGGEPFLRPDLLPVLQAGKRCGLYIGLNTNGALISDNTSLLPYIDSITLSLDGPAEIHERVRPAGSFKTALEAIDIAQTHGVRVQINTTLTEHNTDCIDYLVDLAREKNAIISFQPASPKVLSGDKENPVAGPRQEIVRGLLRIGELRKTVPNIKNTGLVLKYMKMWPFSQGLACAGGRLFFRVASNGDVKVCGRYRPGEKERIPNILKDGVAGAIRRVQKPLCDTCYNVTRLKINLLYDLMTLNWSVLGKRKESS